MISIVDYGMGNLRSVQKVFELLGHPADIVSTPEQIRSADRLILPGVGAFRDAIATLNEKHFSPALHDFVKTGRPLLGICLGLQLLFTTGHEDGVHAGLNLIPGEVRRFTCDQPPHNLKVPHMGWNRLDLHTIQNREPILFRGLPKESFAYFVHSYHGIPQDAKITSCTADYPTPFLAALEKDNIHATQFHPEKSQRVGQLILKNFATL